MTREDTYAEVLRRAMEYRINKSQEWLEQVQTAFKIKVDETSSKYKHKIARLERKAKAYGKRF